VCVCVCVCVCVDGTSRHADKSVLQYTEFVKFSINHAAACEPGATANSCNTPVSRSSSVRLREYQDLSETYRPSHATEAVDNSLALLPHGQVRSQLHEGGGVAGAVGQHRGGVRTGLTAAQLLEPTVPANMRLHELNNECASVRVEVVRVEGATSFEDEALIQRLFLVIALGCDMQVLCDSMVYV
jgi:hypothetical protein